MKKSKVVINQEDISSALKLFKVKGGLIKRLPDQITPQRRLVEAKWNNSELMLINTEDCLFQSLDY